MTSRISCWIHGHRWGAWTADRYEDIFGNVWQLRWCDQCQATQRRCVG